MPRGGSRSEWSSTGELVFEADCRAVVRSEVLRSIMGFEILVKDPLEEWRICTEACRGVHSCSGGSSTSAGTSSSAAIVGGIVLGVVCIVLIPAAPVLPTWSCSFAMFTNGWLSNYERNAEVCRATVLR